MRMLIVEEDGLCPACFKHGGFWFPPYWIHDSDGDAQRCPLGNNWTVGPGGACVPWDGGSVDASHR